MKFIAPIISLLLLFLPFMLIATPQTLQLLPRMKVDPPTVEFSPKVSTWLKIHPVINVGVWGMSPPPLSFGIERGVLTGIDADYLQVLENALKVHFRLQYYEDKEQALAALSKGAITLLAVWNPAINNWQDVRSSLPWLYDYNVLITAANNELNSQTLKEDILAKLDNVAVVPQDLPVSSPFPFKNDHHVANDVLPGQTSSLLINPAPAHILTRNQQADHIWLVPHPLQSDTNFSFGVNKASPELLAAINEVLQHLPAASRLRIAQGWGLGDIPSPIPSQLGLTKPMQDWLQSHPKMIVIVDSRRAPFSYVNAHGQPDGLAIGILRFFTEHYGLKFDYKIVHSDREKTKLIKRHPEAIIAGELTLPDYQDTATLSPQHSTPWLMTPAVLLMKTDIMRPSSLHDLSGEHIALPHYSPLRPWLETWFPLLQLELSDSTAQAMAWLEEGKVRGVITNQFTAHYYRYRQHGERFSLVLPIRALNASFAVADSDSMVLSILDLALQQTPPITFLEMAQRWRNVSRPLNDDSNWSPSFGLLQIIFSAVLLTALAAALWIGYLRQRLRELVRNLHGRQTLIEQLQSAREENVKIVKSHGVFMKSMGHEVRTPLNSLLGLLEVELTRYQDKGQHNENLQAAYESACSLQMLTSDVFDIFRAENDDFEPAPRVVNLPSLVNSTVALYRQQAEEKGLKISTDVETSTPLVECDPLLVIRMLSSLLRNAIKHTTQGEIKVLLCQLTEPVEGRVCMVLEVGDQGNGQPEHFTLTHSPATSEQVAAWAESGFSLADCQLLAQSAGATLSIDRNDQGGTLVSLQFCAASVSLTSSQPLVLPAKPGLILIVDDYPPACMLLRQQLNKLGYSVLAASNGRDGLALWQQHRQKIKAVITDCTMPEMDGFTLTQAIRQRESESTRLPLAIFGLTAMSLQDAEQACLAAGMNACLTKPISVEQIKSLLTPLSEGLVDATTY